MDLKEFVKKAIIDLVGAVDEANGGSPREVILVDGKAGRTVEFDVAVTVEENKAGAGSAGIKVMGIGGDAKMSIESKNSVASRITFGVHVDSLSKKQRRDDEISTSREIANYREGSTNW